MVQRVLDNYVSYGQLNRGTAHGDMRLLSRVPADAQVLRSFKDYLLLELGRSDQTVRGYSQQLLSVGSMLGKEIVDVSVADVRHRVKRDQEVAVSTRQLRVAAFRQLHMWGLLEKEKWADPAMLGVKSIPEPKRLPKPPISLLDATKTLTSCRTPNEYRVAYLGLYAGMRVSESASVVSSNLFGDRLTFIGKGNKERSVPLHPELRKVLPLMIDDPPKTKAVLANSWTKMRDRLGIRDLKGHPATTHSLRRTCADFLYDKAGVEREVVKAILGHGSEVTDLYAPVRIGKMKEAIDRIDYTLGTPVQLTLWGIGPDGT